MNYRITIDQPAIFQTGTAVDNATVFGSLRMARAALDDGVVETNEEAYALAQTIARDLNARDALVEAVEGVMPYLRFYGDDFGPLQELLAALGAFKGAGS